MLQRKENLREDKVKISYHQSRLLVIVHSCSFDKELLSHTRDMCRKNIVIPAKMVIKTTQGQVFTLDSSQKQFTQYTNKNINNNNTKNDAESTKTRSVPGHF